MNSYVNIVNSIKNKKDLDAKIAVAKKEMSKIRKVAIGATLQEKIIGHRAFSKNRKEYSNIYFELVYNYYEILDEIEI